MHVGVWQHPEFLGRSATVAEALEVLAAAGIDGAVLLPTDQCDNAALLAEVRRAVAAGFAGPLWFIAWVRPTGPGNSGDDDLAWARRNLDQVTGLKIHPSLSRTRVTDRGFAAALELAEENDLVVLVHCGRWQEIASYRYAVEAARAYPRVRFLLAHAGGDTPVYATAAATAVAELGLDNVWFELSGLREYWVIERNVELLGADRYLFGSDYCLAHPLMYVGAVRGMRLGERAKQQILGENALALLGPPLTAPA